MDHPLRTLLYELLLEPVLRVLQRILDFVTLGKTGYRPVALPSHRRPRA